MVGNATSSVLVGNPLRTNKIGGPSLRFSFVVAPTALRTVMLGSEDPRRWKVSVLCAIAEGRPLQQQQVRGSRNVVSDRRARGRRVPGDREMVERENLLGLFPQQQCFGQETTESMSSIEVLNTS